MQDQKGMILSIITQTKWIKAKQQCTIDSKYEVIKRKIKINP
jgi:hypothetical protein